MHISLVCALCPATTVVAALSPVLLYVHDHVMFGAVNV
jgi:hypothetical protein